MLLVTGPSERVWPGASENHSALIKLTHMPETLFDLHQQLHLLHGWPVSQPKTLCAPPLTVSQPAHEATATI